MFLLIGNLYGHILLEKDKSSEVRKAAESFMNEILKICGQEVVWLPACSSLPIFSFDARASST